MHVLYYCIDFMLVIGICEDSMMSTSHSELISKFSDLLWVTLVL